MLYSYAQPCDPLLDAGWEVGMVDKTAPDEQNQEDRQQTGTAEGDDGSGKTLLGGEKATSKVTDKKIGGNEGAI
jgi:hypothetical protein